MRSTGRVSEQSAWYDDQPFGVGERVQILGDEQERAGGSEGRVVGYDASGPKSGEDFIRVLVLVDGPTPTIVALPPGSLQGEQVDESRLGVAKTLMTEMEQNLGPQRFAKVLEWLQGDACAKLLANPAIGEKNIRMGTITLPGFVLAEMVQLAATKQAMRNTRSET